MGGPTLNGALSVLPTLDFALPVIASAAAVGLAWVVLRRRKTTVPTMCSVCCPEGSLPFLPRCDYESEGVHDVDLGQGMTGYVAGVDPMTSPSWEGRPVLVLMSDIFGHRSGRHSQIADFWAKSTGGIAVAPDFFGGEPVATPASEFAGVSLVASFLWALISGRFKPWSRRMAAAVDPNLSILCDFLRTKRVARYAAVGFCWGAYPVLKAAANPLRAGGDACPRLAAAAHFHPSAHGIAQLMGEDAIEMARQAAALGVPQLVRVTSMEPASWQPGGAAHSVLRDKLGDKDCDFGAIAGTHGFMVRSTMESTADRAAVRAGVDALVSFCVERLQ